MEPVCFAKDRPLFSGLTSGMGSKGVGDLKPGFSHQEERTWFTFSPVCREVSGSRLPSVPFSVQNLPPRQDLAPWFLRAVGGDHLRSDDFVKV